MGGAIFSMLLFFFVANGWAQSGGNGGGSGNNGAGSQPGAGAPLPGRNGRGIPPASPLDNQDPGNMKRVEEQQANTRNVDRQKRLQADTEKLLSLATQLKEEVDKTDKNMLSLEVIKKADEIEKLAKSVKDRMKG
jgi:hypothetical protein